MNGSGLKMYRANDIKSLEPACTIRLYASIVHAQGNHALPLD